MRQLIVALGFGLFLIAQPQPDSALASPLAAGPGAAAFVGLPEVAENRLTNIAPPNWVSHRAGGTLMSDDHQDFNLLGSDVLKAAAVWDRYVPDAREQSDRFWAANLHRVQPISPTGSPLCWQPFSQPNSPSVAGAFGAFDHDGIKLRLSGAQIAVQLPDNRPGQYSWESVDQQKKYQEQSSVALLMDPKTGVKSFTEYHEPAYEHAVSRLWDMQIQGRMLDFVNEFGRFPNSLEVLGLAQGVAFAPSDLPVPMQWSDILEDTQPAFYILMSPQTGTLELVAFVPGGPKPPLRLLPHRLEYEFAANGRVQPILGFMGKLQPPTLDPSFCVRAWRVPIAP